MRYKTKLAIQQSLCATLSLGFLFDPGTVARATADVSADVDRGGSSAVGYILDSLARQRGRALNALDRYLFPHCKALGPNDLVESNIPNAFMDTTSNGTQVPLSSGLTTTTIDVGFNFPFYGQTFSQVAVGSQGYLLLGNGVGCVDRRGVGKKPRGQVLDLGRQTGTAHDFHDPCQRTSRQTGTAAPLTRPEDGAARYR